MWRNKKKGRAENEKEAIGVLVFEVINSMDKIVNLWLFLRDKDIHRLRREILNSVGLQKLVSSDPVYLMDLALDEVMDTIGNISKSVVRLGRNCTDPHFRRFEFFVSNPILYKHEWLGWDYKLNKMERKVKKMERFVSVTMQLAQEFDVLEERKRTLRRMKANRDMERVILLEFQQKVAWQREEVRTLKEMSPWVRTYDYTVRLLARSLLTVLERIILVFDIDQPPADKDFDAVFINPDFLSRNRSFPGVSSVYLLEHVMCGLTPAPNGRSGSKSAPTAEKSKQPMAPLGSLKRCVISETYSPFIQGSELPVGSGFMGFGKDYVNPAPENRIDLEYVLCSNKIYIKLAQFNSKHGLLDAPSSTLGNAALALHYARVIKMIEKLASSPCTIDSEIREDLYSMLTSSIRASLRVRLKAYAKSQNPFVYDASVVGKWSMRINRILKWLSPLAHNMIKWHSERNFEMERDVAGSSSPSNVLLVQTLHYANQAKAEVAIVKLLVGLNCICKANRQHIEEVSVSPEFYRRKTAYSRMPKLSNHRHDLV